VLTAPLRAKNTRLTQAYRRFFREAANVERIPLTQEIADRAAILRADVGLATADAIIAATALESDCEALLTNDRDLRRVSGLRVLLVEDYL
jgi:predicted nucleic acid-binding protein